MLHADNIFLSCGGQQAFDVLDADMKTPGPFRAGFGFAEVAGCQVSVLAGTVFQDAHLPLTVWFRAMWHITSQKNGVSALGLQRALGLGSYKTVDPPQVASGDGAPRPGTSARSSGSR